MLLPSSDINSLYNSLICFFSFQIYYYLILFGLFSLLFLSYLSLSLLSSLHPLESLGEILGKIIDGEKSVYGIISFLSCNSSHSIHSLSLFSFLIASLSRHSTPLSSLRRLPSSASRSFHSLTSCPFSMPSIPLVPVYSLSGMGHGSSLR